MFDIVKDMNEQIVYFCLLVIGLLIKECIQVFLNNEIEIFLGIFEGVLIKYILECLGKVYKYCLEVFFSKIYCLWDVLDIELVGFRVINIFFELMIDVVILLEKVYLQLFINCVLG